MNDTKALMWIWLKLAVNDSSEKIYKLFDYFKDIRAVYESTPKELGEISFLSDKYICRLLNKDLYKAREILLLCQENKINMVSLDEPEYPQSLLEIESPPCVLFTYGNYKKAMSKPAVTIVGTRHCTDYGKRVTAQISGSLALCGCTIVTGIAEGIDQTAYQSAIKANGSVILVLPAGILVSRSAQKIPSLSYTNGVLISEHLPHSTQTTYAYPERNRILSGLSSCCVITQAPEKSGALITANHALSQGKDIFVPPANIDIIQSLGSNRLFFDGAIPVMSYKDILDVMMKYHPDMLKDVVNETDIKYFSQYGIPGNKSIDAYIEAFKPLLDEETSDILDLFDDFEVNFDYLRRESEMPIPKLLSIISKLESAGAIISLPGNKYKINM